MRGQWLRRLDALDEWVLVSASAFHPNEYLRLAEFGARGSAVDGLPLVRVNGMGALVVSVSICHH